MSERISKVLRVRGPKATYYCQGCDMVHMINVEPNGAEPVWTWDGSMDHPTFGPSVLVRWETRSEKAREVSKAFYDQHGDYPTLEQVPYDKKHVCHTFIRGGLVEFLSDCTHQHAGQTLPLPPLPDWLLDTPRS